MSTNAESALKWLDEQSPSAEEIRDVTEKLKSRIRSHQGDEIIIQGSIEALELLEQVLADAELPAAEPDSTPEASTFLEPGIAEESNWQPDAGQLGTPEGEIAPPPESDSEKKRRFEHLKKQLDNR